MLPLAAAFLMAGDFALVFSLFPGGPLPRALFEPGANDRHLGGQLSPLGHAFGRCLACGVVIGGQRVQLIWKTPPGS